MRDSMRRVASHLPRRQVWFFLLAVVVPSLVLTVMAVWITAQERELAIKRARDDEARAVDDIRAALSRHLDRQTAVLIRAWRDHRATPADALVARIAHGRLVLPWEEHPTPDVLPADQRFTRAVQDGEAREFGIGDFDGALERYDAAIAVAGDDRQRAFARLLRARAATAAGRREPARRQYYELLALPPTVTDEYGIPVWAYAALALTADARGDHADVRARIIAHLTRDLSDIARLTPAARYRLRDVVDRLSLASEAGARLRQRLDDSIQHGEQALALQRAFPLDGLAEAASGAPAWVLFGHTPWLVSIAPAPEPVLLARSVAAVATELTVPRVGELQLLPGDARDGEWLGDRFPGVKVAYTLAPGAGQGRALQRWFPMAIVLFSLAVTACGAYLLWRDVHREARLAALRSQFVSSVSHELKTPLTAIRMFAETLRLGRARDEATAGEYLDTIISESERLTRLLNNVLEFSKLERGATRFHIEPTPIHAPLQRVLRALRYPLEQQGFRLRLEIDDDLPPVPMDADAIEQALVNLLVNAMKYSGAGRDITLRATRNDEAAEIAVADCGIGIPLAEQGRVFEKFYRAATAETRHISGAGLGLTLVDHIARAHGGAVRLVSAPGAGSTFTLVLPLAADAAGPAVSLAHTGQV